MGRGRMELIKKEKNRIITFQKRKEGLMKKAYELSTLCGIDVCVIINASHFDDKEGSQQLETWPQDTKDVYRIIEKYNNTTIDRRTNKIYDVQEYYKDRIKKVEGERAKVRREKFKIMYPTWDESFNALGEQQLRMFATMLDNKLDVCNQRINVLKQDQKGRVVITEEQVPFKTEIVTPNLASNNSTSYHNFLTNIYEGDINGVPHMKPDSDSHNYVPFYPFNLGQISHFDQNSLHFWEPIKSDCIMEEGVENTQNSSASYNGNMQTMQTHNCQNLQNEAAFETQAAGFQINEFYDTNALEPQMFNYMHGWNNRP